MTDGPVTLISPHHDDIALSLALTAHCLAGRVELRIVNCFTRSRFAPGAPLRGEDEVSARRLEEDRAFARELGLESAVINLEFRDASLREPRGIRAIFRSGSLRQEDLEQATALSRVIRDSSGAGPLIAPLAIGSHIDHRLAREAAIVAGASRPLAFYEDLPYAARCELDEVAAAADRIGHRIGAGLTPVVICGDEQLRVKERLILLYESQVSAAARGAVLDYARRYGGERLWVTARFRQLLVKWSDLGLLTLGQTRVPSRSTIAGSIVVARRAGM